MKRKPYPTDPTDEQWDALGSLLPRPESGTPEGGRPAADSREVANAIFRHPRDGGAWRMSPHDVPTWPTVYGYVRGRRQSGAWERVRARLREEVRIGAGAAPAPETPRADSPTVKATHRGGPEGYGGGKKVGGRERFVAVDSLGLIRAVAADVRDRDGGRWRRDGVREVIADAGFAERFAGGVRRVAAAANAPDGFRVRRRRWVVGRTFARPVRYRRRVVDREYGPETSEAMILAAMTHRMLRLLHPVR